MVPTCIAVVGDSTSVTSIKLWGSAATEVSKLKAGDAFALSQMVRGPMFLASTQKYVYACEYVVCNYTKLFLQEHL